MYTDEDVEGAVAAGLMSAEAAAGLRTFVAGKGATIAADEEHFRLVSGFNDIFVTIAVVLILSALAWMGGQLDPMAGALAVAAAAWGLAEYFTRRRRMALPSIVLLLGFVGGVCSSCLFLAGHVEWSGYPNSSWWLVGSGVITVAAAWLHWWRFCVPITVAAGAGAAIGTAVALLLALFPDLSESWAYLMLAGGLAAFVLAMRWDASDLARTTRRSDAAFWLHLLAAPLIVHPVFFLLGMLEPESASTFQAALAVVVYAVLAVVALAIDRRAVLISALAYVLFAMSQLFQALGSLTEDFALTSLVIGSALLLLSAFWHRGRRAVLVPLPAGLRARLPGCEVAR